MRSFQVIRVNLINHKDPRSIIVIAGLCIFLSVQIIIYIREQKLRILF